ncbi:hypothetical protein [Ancylomarina sp. 16SWW S1-10-2]|uniref:hypothetical protein n=1 Tax=Ancylomarina sp. 16SWW S1-10-2 TaxID=2499681 RepID=UPI0012ADC714|nr:hypothetical protein [Ancylomarina sp. 16SWW S1-10-2]MRT93609.1 hypothetical protein [Ancylomarina sp. 16SWW S1-10-2]
MNVEYSYVDVLDKRILCRKFTENACLNDVVASFEEIMKNEMLSENTIGIISDLRGVTFDINLSVFKRVSSFLKLHPELYTYKLAAITDTPKQVVLVIIANNVSSKLNAKPFSTFDASLKWMTENI